MQHRSRDALRARVLRKCRWVSSERSVTHHAERWVSLRSTHPTKRNDDHGKKEAERRQTCSSNLRAPTFILPRVRGRTQEGARRAPFISSPSPACGGGLGGGTLAYRRSTAALAAASERRSSAPDTHFLGLGRTRDPKASNNRVRKTVRFFSGRYPRLPVPVQRVTSQTGRNAGRAYVPKPPGNGVYRSARGHRTRSAFGSTLGRRRPSLSEIF